MPKFNMSDFAKTLGMVPEQGTKQIEYIDIDLLHEDPRNFYEVSGVDELASNIALFGLMDPLLVRSTEDGTVQIVSGHRRHAALRKLVEEGHEELRQVPCIRVEGETSPALQELRLIYANADTRIMTSAEIAKQAARVAQLLYQLKEDEGMEFPGRMRDHVAEICKVNKTKLSNLKVIREKLIPEAKKAWEKNDFSEDTALTLARLPEDVQRKVCEAYREYRKKSYGSASLKYFLAGEAKGMADRLGAMSKLKCPEGGECSNRDNKWQADVGRPYCYGSCHKQCCAKCDKLVSCKYACPKLAEQIKRLKADRKAEQAREKALKEEKERPDRELQELLWSRFAQARKDAGVSLEKLYEKWDVKYPSTYIRDFEKYERGEGLRLGVSTETPLHPYSSYLSHAKYLICLADTLDVSLDYLLGRTPCQKPEQMFFGVDLAESKPTWRTDEPEDGTVVLAKFTLPGTDKPLIRKAYYFCGKYYFDKASHSTIDTDCLGWTPIPED